MSSFRDDMKQDDVITVIRQYLDSLENDNRRLQAVNNLLKWARDEGNRLQRAIG
jgi:predicted AAA+ superfamily ATPase